MHNMIDVNVSVKIPTHPFGTSDTSCVEDCKTEEKMERAEYAVEGQASHTGERYLWIAYNNLISYFHCGQLSFCNSLHTIQ